MPATVEIKEGSTYFAGAVYDERIDGKVEACVAHTTMLYLLAMAGWLTENRKFDLGVRKNHGCSLS